MNTVRIWFSKTGHARFISHLDLNRTMMRALRRAGLPIWYTEGFNRHPYVTFAAPLSLGYEGLRETMDVRLEEPVPMDELVRKLDAAMPEGLHVLAAAEAQKKPGDVAASRYRLTVACPPEDVSAFLQQPSIVVEKRTKKKTFKPLELRPVLDAAQCQLTPSQADADGTVSTCLELVLPSSSELSVNPSLVIDALTRFTGRETLPLTVCRLDIYDRQGVPFA